jgi:hypothetical protein
MGQWDVYNEILLKLSEKSSRFGEITGDYEAAAEHLRLENLIFSIVKEWNNSLNYGKTVVTERELWYAIHPNGIKLIASLPPEYTERPYDYFLKQKQDAIDAEAHFKELINKASQSTIRTSHWTRWLFIVTAVMAAATLALAIYPFIYKSAVYTDLQQIRNRLEQLEEKALSHTQTTPPPPLVKPQTKSGPVSAIDSSKK